MAKRAHPRHPKEHDILKAIRRTPPLIGGELPARKERRAQKRKKTVAVKRKKR